MTFRYYNLNGTTSVREHFDLTVYTHNQIGSTGIFAPTKHLDTAEYFLCNAHHTYIALEDVFLLILPHLKMQLRSLP